ncbi:MAG TPA: DoxX family protein [Alphaproteobacteria bacterium]
MPQYVDTQRDLGALAGRVLMSLIFIWAGYAKLVAPTATITYYATYGLPLPQVAWLISVVVELGGGLALLLGFQARIVGLVMAAWCVATAVVAHTNFADHNMQIHFMKNLAIAGGFLYVAAFGAGAYTIQRAFRSRDREIHGHA